MPTTRMARVLFIFCAQLSYCIEYETTLTASHTSAYDESIAISTNTEHVQVNTSSNTWRLEPQSQQSYDLLLTLNNDLSFHPSAISQITIEIDGNTPAKSMNDSEFLIVFAGNHKYFSVVIRLDTQNTLWKYYPSAKVLATTDDIYNDIISGEEALRQRWDRVSDNDKWSNILPRYKKALKWPLTVKLINNPLTNTLQYECAVNDVVLYAEYDDIFASNDTKIYIMNDADDGKPVDIYSIKVQYEDDTTAAPEVITTTIDITTSEFDAEIPTTTSITTETTKISETELETQLETETQTEMQMDPDNTLAEELKAFASENPTSIEAGVMAAVVIACVCFTVAIVVGIWYYFKREQEVNSPHSVNKSEYHTPKLNLSNTDIENVLEKKRKESVQHSAGFVVHAKRTKHAVIAVKSHESDEEGDDGENDIFIRDSNC